MGDDDSIVWKGFDVTWVDHEGTAYAALVCVIIACALTSREIKDHIGRFDYPRIQVYVLRILLMVPIYGIFSIASSIPTRASNSRTRCSCSKPLNRV